LKGVISGLFFLQSIISLLLHAFDLVFNYYLILVAYPAMNNENKMYLVRNNIVSLNYYCIWNVWTIC